ncbi:unnamed protein product, partial [Discosporangium mesarthrocarpum]
MAIIHTDHDDTAAHYNVPSTVQAWVSAQRELLRLERDEERAQVADTIANLSGQARALECVERGVSLVPVVVTGVTTGLYGRACVSVGDPKGRPLPAHRLGAGDEVRLYSTKGKGVVGEQTEITGVIGKTTEHAVEIISDDADEPAALRPPLRLDVVASEATHKKMIKGLDCLESYAPGGPAERVRDVLFGLAPPQAPKKPPAPPPAGQQPGSLAPRALPGDPSARSDDVITPGLNESQRAAVSFALGAQEVALIHGPPGTGKTTTVVELVLQAVSRGWRCLVCAPSNVAVDGVLDRLVAAGGWGEGSGAGGRGGPGARTPRVPRVVRLGHPAKLLPKALEHSLEAIVSRHDGTTIVKEIRQEIDALVGKLSGNRTASGVWGGAGGERREAKKQARREIKALRKDARVREKKIVKEVIHSREVVLATCVGAAAACLQGEEFDLVVIDEAAQVLSLARTCW